MLKLDLMQTLSRWLDRRIINEQKAVQLRMPVCSLSVTYHGGLTDINNVPLRTLLALSRTLRASLQEGGCGELDRVYLEGLEIILNDAIDKMFNGGH